jgi:V-type H+-transporting ATPase subunit H
LALPKPFDLLLSLLDNAAAPIPLLSSAVLTTMISTSLAANSKAWDSVKDALPKLYRYLSTVSKSQDLLQDLAIQSYTSLLRAPYARTTFWEMKEETVNPLFGILESAAGGNGNGAGGERSTLGGSGIVQGGVPLQLLYHVLLVIWQMTFDEVVSEEITA